MQGTKEDPGIIFKTGKYLFQIMQQLQQAKLGVSYLEVYKEKVYDLLVKPLSSAIKDLPIREDGKRIVVAGLTSSNVNSYEEFVQIYNKGLNNRKVSATKLNSTSSRSHAILTFTLTYRQSEPPFQYITSKFNLADLAGSEDNRKTGNTGVQLAESTAINLSLLTLRKVVNAVNDGKAQIPFRESKLTRLLQDSLGGSSQAIMISNVSPYCPHYQETYKALEFSRKTKSIVNRVVQNQASVYASEEERKYSQSLMRTGYISAPPMEQGFENLYTTMNNGREARIKVANLNPDLLSTDQFATKADLAAVCRQLLSPHLRNKKSLEEQVMNRIESLEHKYQEVSQLTEQSMRSQKQQEIRLEISELKRENKERMILRNAEQERIGKVLFPTLGNEPISNNKSIEDMPDISNEDVPTPLDTMPAPATPRPRVRNVAESPVHPSSTLTPHSKKEEGREMIARANDLIRQKEYHRAGFCMEQAMLLLPNQTKIREKYDALKRKIARLETKKQNTPEVVSKPVEDSSIPQLQKSSSADKKRVQRPYDEEEQEQTTPIRPLKRLKRTSEDKENIPIDTNIQQSSSEKAKDKIISKIKKPASEITVRIAILKYINDEENREKDLRKLTSVGEKTAQKMINNRPFISLNELTSIGMTEKGVSSFVAKNTETIWNILDE
jgi:DNA uptake protein ComE-like DNA-binding protein/uncharacterized protein YdcH (DUF465 family)